MNNYEAEAKELLEKHDCKLIGIIFESLCIWENKIGIKRIDDIFALKNMSESNFNFWANN